MTTKTKLLSIHQDTHNGKTQTERIVNLEKQRIIKAFSDINFKDRIEDSTKTLPFGNEIDINDAIDIIQSAVPNGLNRFYPSDLERISETFKNTKVQIARNNGIILKVIGQPVIDPVTIKFWIGADKLTIEDNSYIYGWN